jgi:hypothetical protein
LVDTNRLAGDASLNSPIRADDDPAEWQDWLFDEGENHEVMIAEGDEFDGRRKALSDALALLTPRERRVFERRRLTDEPVPCVTRPKVCCIRRACTSDRGKRVQKGAEGRQGSCGL